MQMKINNKKNSQDGSLNKNEDYQASFLSEPTNQKEIFCENNSSEEKSEFEESGSEEKIEFENDNFFNENGKQVQTDDLLIDNRKILQFKNGYHFTSDSVRLAKFVNFKKTDKICEFCSGSGIISILLAVFGAKNLSMIEIQKDIAILSEKSVEINNFQNNIKVFNEDLFGIHKKLGTEAFDIIVCNPPYEKENKKVKLSEDLAISKFEIKTNLGAIVNESNKLLKFGGKLFLVLPATRLFEFSNILIKFNFKIKAVKFFAPKNKVNTVYLCAVKGAKEGTKIEIF